MTPETPLQPHPAQAVSAKWLKRFEKCVRQRDYVNAEAMCHKQCVGFGLSNDRCSTVSEWNVLEWHGVWPHQVSFTFDHGSAHLIFEHGLILISLPWVAQSTIHGAPAKGGRATIGLMMFENDKVLAVHLHFSRNVE